MTAQSSTLLITGASGYLGTSLTRQAVTESGDAPGTVVGTFLSRPTHHWSGRHWSGRHWSGVEMVRLDITSDAAVRCLLTELQPQTVIHTAADMTTVQAMEAVIVEGTSHVAGACASTGAHMVHLSTDVVFDGEGAPYTEDDPLSPLHAYGRAKAAAEEIVSDFCPDAAIVRTSLIYGFEPLDPRTRWVVDSIRAGEPITLFVDEVRCPVWVEQLAAALLELAARREAGIWHVAGSQPLSRYEFGVRLAGFLGVDPAEITPGMSRASGLLRPRDCRLDVRKVLTRLHVPLWGVDETLSHLQGRL